MNVRETILDILYPPRCAFCGTLMERQGDGVCAACHASLPYIPAGADIQELDGFLCVRTFYYENMVPVGIRAFKFKGKPNRAPVFGSFLARTVEEQLAGRFDSVTYAPLNVWRRYVRGYDQSELLAQSAAKVLNAPLYKTLRKTRNTRPQSSIHSLEKRRAIPPDLYVVSTPAAVRGRRFLLIDDVVTTGATITACANALKKAGCASVVCAVLAGGHPEKAAEEGHLEKAADKSHPEKVTAPDDF